MERQQIAERVAEDVHRTEEALDEALGRASELMGRLIEARRQAGVSTTIGHDIFERIHNASGFITQARGEMILAHKRLGLMAKVMRLAPMLTAPVDKPDDIDSTATVRLVTSRDAQVA